MFKQCCSFLSLVIELSKTFTLAPKPNADLAANSPKTLAKALRRCDVAVGSIRGKERTPVVVSDATIQTMKKGAIIVDVSIDRGGCFETSKVTSHSNPTFEKHGVIHYQNN